MMYGKFFAERLAALRQQKNVSAREMSLAIGQNDSYINRIENGKAFPSMQAFFYICEYLNISPKDFFDAKLQTPQITNELSDLFAKLPPAKAEHLLQVAKDLVSE